MHTTSFLTATLASLTAASPVIKRDTTAVKNNFEITNFVFGCTVTCDWSFDVVDKNAQLPGHPGFSTPIHCKGSKGTDTSFDVDTCETISQTQRVAAYINDKDILNLQYRNSVPGEAGHTGATYWFEGSKEVGAATGYNPSPSTFEVPETKAYAVA